MKLVEKVRVTLTMASGPAQPEYRAGECLAEYNLPTPVELATPDPAVVDFFNRSKSVSR
jgi:hypothetical protein